MIMGRYWYSSVNCGHDLVMIMTPSSRAGSSISAIRRPCYPFIAEIAILGVIYGRFVWKVSNPVATGLSPELQMIGHDECTGCGPIASACHGV